MKYQKNVTNKLGGLRCIIFFRIGKNKIKNSSKNIIDLTNKHFSSYNCIFCEIYEKFWKNKLTKKFHVTKNLQILPNWSPTNFI